MTERNNKILYLLEIYSYEFILEGLKEEDIDLCEE